VCVFREFVLEIWMRMWQCARLMCERAVGCRINHFFMVDTLY
jgi:hypothetical protein